MKGNIMKVILKIFKVLFTIALSIIIIPTMLVTMTLYSVTQAVSPDTLSGIIKDVVLSGANQTASSEVCDSTGLPGDLGDLGDLGNMDAEGLEALLNSIKYDTETGILTFGENGKIDIGSTGLLEIEELKNLEFTEETITSIISSPEFTEVITEYGSSIIDAVLNGEEKLPEITPAQLGTIAGTVIEAVEEELEIEIPTEVKQNVKEEVSKNSGELTQIVNKELPTINEIKDQISESAGVDTETLDMALAAVKMLFDSTLLLIACGVVAFLALLILLLNLKKLNGLLIVGIYAILCGLIFIGAGSLSDLVVSFLPSEIVQYANLVTKVLALIMEAGIIAAVTGVALIIIKIVVGNVLLGRRHKAQPVVE